jgi:hypothetical protein
MHDTKLLFVAQTTDEEKEKICIMFVRRYSNDVHTLCASEGFAPALYGFEKLPDVWHMVVMQMIEDDYSCLR